MNRLKGMKKKTALVALSFSLLFGGLPAGAATAGEAAAVTVTAADASGHWAEPTLRAWLDKGNLQGYADGTVQPDRVITRAEFITLVNRVFGFQKQAAVTLSDLETSDWAYAQVALALQAGYISGYEDNTFRPEAPVSRQEAAVMLSRLLKVGDSVNREAVLAAYPDAGNAPEWSRTALAGLVSHGYLAGYEDGTLRPQRPVTRAEAVVLLDRAAAAKPGSAAAVYDRAGTYGPAAGTESVTGDVRITVGGVTLQNLNIAGKLILEEGIGEGDVGLRNVTVAGETVVSGGGEHSIHIADSTLGDVTVQKKTGPVRLAAEGQTKVSHVKATGPVHLDNSQAAGGGFSWVSLEEGMPAGTKIKLTGSFERLEILAGAIAVEAAGGTIGEAAAGTGAAGSTLTLGKDAKIGSLSVSANVKIAGPGSVGKATILKGGEGATFETAPQSKVLGPGVIAPGAGGGAGSTASVVEPDPPVTKEYTAAGTYGPDSGNEAVYGNVVIRAGGVILRNMTIYGNLTVGEEVGLGDVDLDHVEVKGNTEIRGGGPHSVKLFNTFLDTIFLFTPPVYNTRIVTLGGTLINNLNINSDSNIDTTGSTGGGIRQVNVLPTILIGSKLKFVGPFQSINLYSTDTTLNIDGSVDNLNVSEGSSGSTLQLGSGSSIQNVQLSGTTEITGSGTINNVTLNSGGLGSTFEKKPNNLTLGSELNQTDSFGMSFAEYDPTGKILIHTFGSLAQVQTNQFQVKAMAFGVQPVNLPPPTVTIGDDLITITVPPIGGSADGQAVYRVEYGSGPNTQFVSTAKIAVPVLKVLTAEVVPNENQGLHISGTVTPSATDVWITLTDPRQAVITVPYTKADGVTLSPDGSFEFNVNALSLGEWLYKVEAAAGNQRSPAVSGTATVVPATNRVPAQVADSKSSITMSSATEPGDEQWVFEFPSALLKPTVGLGDLVITGLPAGLQPQVSYSNDLAGRRMAIRLTGTAAAPVTSPVTVHITVKMSAVDSSFINADSRPVQVTLLPFSFGTDRVPPSTVTSVVYSGLTSTGVTLSWGASTDNVGVTGYAVYGNDTLWGTVTGTTYSSSALLPSTLYNIQVKAYDAAGNYGAAGTVSFTTLTDTPDLPDTTPPSRITHLVADNITPSSVTLTWDASTDNVGVVKYEIYSLYGSDLTLVDTTTTTEYTVTGLESGQQYVFSVKAVDAAGNRSTRTDTAQIINIPYSPDQEAVNAAANALNIGYAFGDSEFYVRSDVTFPVLEPNGVHYVWNTYGSSWISNTGKVTRPDDADQTVTVTATVYKLSSSVYATRTFTLTVKKADPASIRLVPIALTSGYVTTNIQITGTGTNFNPDTTTLTMTDDADHEVPSSSYNFQVMSPTQAILTVYSGLGHGGYPIKITTGSKSVSTILFIL